MRYQAILSDGQTAATTPVEVEFFDSRVVVSNLDQNAIAEWHTNDFSVEVHGLETAFLTHRKSGAVLEIKGRDPVLALRASRGNAWFHERRAAIYVGLVALLVALAVGLFLAANPVSQAIAAQIPYEWEQNAARSVDVSVAGKPCQGPSGNAALEKLVSRLAQADPAAPWKTPEVHVVTNSMVNAFTFLGGKIVVTDALLDSVQSPAELAGVIAHELGHAAERHVLASLVRATLLTAIWTFSMGDVSGVLVLDPATVHQILSLRFDRNMESRADQYAIRMLSKAEISLNGMREFFERTSKEEKVPSMLEFISTHPNSAARRDAIDEVIKSNPQPKDTSAGLTPDEWRMLQYICAYGPEPEPSH